LLERLGLRAKLVLAFGAIAALAGLCGLIGLVFVNRSAETVREFTDVTSLLQGESVALVETAQRTRSTFLNALSRGETTEQFSRQLTDLRAETEAHIAELRRLSSRAQIDIHIPAIEESEKAFSGMLASAVAVSARERSAAAAARDSLTKYEASYKTTEPALISIADRAEGEVMRAEEIAKVQVQTRTATVDGLGDLVSQTLNNTYPVVQNANRLLRELEQIDDRVKLMTALSGQNQLARIEQELKRSFRGIRTTTRKLVGRLGTSDNQSGLTDVQDGFARIESIVLGPGGVLESERARTTARAALAAEEERFDQIERAYFAALGEVEGIVRQVNEDAKVRTELQAAQARTATAAGAVFTLVAGTLVGLFFAHRLTSPLMRMTRQITDIRDSGELKALPDPSIAGRGDEIGTLSRSFNEMIAELAEARRELIARSEAEINKQFRRLDLAINSMPQGLCMFDADEKLIISNHRFSQIYDIPPEYTLPGTSLRTILEGGAAADVGAGIHEFSEDLLRSVANRTPWHYVFELRDGRSIAISHVPVPGGGSIATHEDITERRKAEEKIAYMAHHDMLTDLPNRVQFRNDMQEALATLRDKAVAVLSLDLDYFKRVNDTLGHPVGDMLLKSVAGRLRSCLRPEDKVARLGGDEFSIIQVGADQPVGSTTLAGRLINDLSEPYTIDGNEVVVGASVGISIAPNDGTDADRLLKNADMALYRAKEDGRGIYRFFEPGMDARMQARRRLELDLRKSLASGEFTLLYQPVVNLDTGAVSTCESLLQWHHPERGLVPPNEFMPLAEEIGLINPIGAWVLKQACSDAQRWPNEINVAVNLSAAQFKSGKLVLDVIAALGASGLAGRRLELEITEAVLLDETASTLATLNELHDLGVRISMDEFGTGYSSLGYLRKFPFDKIKIDRSFIDEIANKPDSIAIVRAVAGLSNTLGIVTTADGVETKAQMRQLKKEGCIEGQGGLFSAPKSAYDLEQLFAHRHGYTPAVA
jgi:diguanylate cyclase (GGDEF)-like protein